MLHYKWETLTPTTARIHRIVRDLLGVLISHTQVILEWSHPIPPDNYLEKLYLSKDPL